MTAKVLLLGLDDSLAGTLSLKLTEMNYETGALAEASPDLVFTTLARLRQTRQQLPGVPAVVVSRLPETHEWLDALEGGAVDYCAAPFETRSLKWILDGALRSNRGLAAA